MGRPRSSDAKPTMEPAGYSPPCSRPKVLRTAYRPSSTSVRHSSANGSFAALAWCSRKRSISGSTFASLIAESALTSCARGVAQTRRRGGAGSGGAGAGASVGRRGARTRARRRPSGGGMRWVVTTPRGGRPLERGSTGVENWRAPTARRARGRPRLTLTPTCRASFEPRGVIRAGALGDAATPPPPLDLSRRDARSSRIGPDASRDAALERRLPPVRGGARDRRWVVVHPHRPPGVAHLRGASRGVRVAGPRRRAGPRPPPLLAALSRRARFPGALRGRRGAIPRGDARAAPAPPRARRLGSADERGGVRARASRASPIERERRASPRIPASPSGSSRREVVVAETPADETPTEETDRVPETEAPGEAPDARSPRARDVSPARGSTRAAAGVPRRRRLLDPANAETPSSEARPSSPSRRRSSRRALPSTRRRGPRRRSLKTQLCAAAAAAAAADPSPNPTLRRA